MATPIFDLYDSFLGKITDYGFVSPNTTQQDIEDDLFGYFKVARAKFYRCKQDLTTVDDGTGTGGLTFTVDLTGMEIEVLTTLMLVEYIKPKLITDETLKQSLSDKDFKIYSQASQIREIRLLMASLKSEASKLITEYTFMDLEGFEQNPQNGRSSSNGTSSNYTGYRQGGGGYDYEQ